MGLTLEVSTVLHVQCTNLIVCRWSHDQSETEYGALKFGGERGEVECLMGRVEGVLLAVERGIYDDRVSGGDGSCGRQHGAELMYNTLHCVQSYRFNIPLEVFCEVAKSG